MNNIALAALQSHRKPNKLNKFIVDALKEGANVIRLPDLHNVYRIKTDKINILFIPEN